ncbi:MAG: 2,3,4,5-tetrahydropyridine-2,6-dicarboxylate N-succinyltransferase, partial [Alphaproteobacteria bacterium]
MHDHPLRPAIERLWDERQSIDSSTKGEARDQVDAVLDALDAGSLRVAAPGAEGWVVHEWLKKAVLLSFRLNDSVPMEAGT